MGSLLEKHGLTQKAFADRIGAHPYNISRYVHGRKYPRLPAVTKMIVVFPEMRYLVDLFHFEMEDGSRQINAAAHATTQDKAYVLGVVGPGDGCVLYYRIALSVTDKDFADTFKDRIERIYGIATCGRAVTPNTPNEKKEYEVTLNSRAAIEDLLRYGASLKEKDWKIPQAIKSAPLEIIAHYVRGFADSQGHVSVPKKYIQLFSKNVVGLREMTRLLDKLGIKSKVVTFASQKSHIRIGGRPFLERFARTVGFSIRRKQRALERILAGYKRTSPYDVDSRVPEMVRLRSNGRSTKEIAHMLQVSVATVTRRLKVPNWRYSSGERGLRSHLSHPYSISK